MAMVIQHNLTAMNSNRQLGVITSGQAKSSEKLSSGYKINRAADDAAGLKISEDEEPGSWLEPGIHKCTGRHFLNPDGRRCIE